MRVAVDGVYFSWGRSADELVELVAATGADGANWQLAEGFAEPTNPGTWDMCGEMLGRNAISVVTLAAGSQNS
ncbi:MAG TPA: hypothetical protein QGH10_02575, partial [Armatimonadota bacterium]|nr:hypothetical protein [Armatimonadota bacterium]